MQTLNAPTVPLTGINLIEASAGTGKTWTISWLYLRLVAEEGLRVDQILVVTYTEAATAELRYRIRKRLADALAFLEGRDSGETYPSLLTQDSPEVCITRLQLALVSFDEAAVFTIHGFCKRVLTENAFEARLPFESELVANEDNLLLELADTFWYQHFLKPSDVHLRLLQQQGLTPDKLLATVRLFIGKPYLHEVIPAVVDDSFTQAKAAFNSAMSAAESVWREQQSNIQALLHAALNGKVLNAQTYKADKVNTWLLLIEAVFTNGFVEKEAAEALEKLGARYLQSKTNKAKSPPTHAFFDALDVLHEAHSGLQALLPGALEHLRLQLLHYLRRELPLRKQQRGLLTFDDLLLQLEQALTRHPGFAQRLAAQYQAALIDEFQDTDPIQYAIFGCIYPPSVAEQPQRVFYVGDPKQAIYGFRGADIHTYLQAAHHAQQRYTLGQNFRSHADLLAALNHLFGQSSNPFRGEIAYEEVVAGKEQAAIFLPDSDEETPLPPLRLWEWDVPEEHRGSDVEDALAAATADDIARLLNAGQQGQAVIGDKPLRSGDIAVLVRTSRQGERVRNALLERGIASVQRSRDSIFSTREASEWRAVLRAIAEPGNEAALKQALITELFGYSAEQLHALEQQPALLESALEAFHDWHKIWKNQGFMPMFRRWLRQQQRDQYLLGFVDGERRLTNLLHLAELIHTETRLHGHGMHALIRWLQQKAEAAEAEETHQLRLESDAELVQIVTIHKSKGLEYAVVYCPYLWQEREPSKHAWFSWYDTTQGEGVPCLQADSLATDAQRQQRWEEEKAENLRLLYVALTRAKYHCTLAVVTGAVSRFDYYSALGWLLFGDLPQQAAILGKATKDKMQAPERQALMQAQLQAIVSTSQNTIGLESVPLISELRRYCPPVVNAEPPIAPPPLRLRATLKVGSFSGLVAGKDDEKPDYDSLALLNTSALGRDNGRGDVFPRGAQAGSCLHKMLEELDFMQSVAAQRDSVLLPALQRHGMAERWLPAAERLLEQVLHTPLIAAATGRQTLAQLPKARRMDELEFYFWVDRFRLPALQRVLREHLPVEWTAIHAAIERLKFPLLTGYMKGFIDLIFEADGQYYIVDYKSNELGATAADYAFDAMQQAMAEHHYYLQYLIYSVALQRYLRLRLADYAWETHVGGVLYLILRGMQPSVAGSGVFFHKPDAALIDALDQVMG